MRVTVVGTLCMCTVPLPTPWMLHLKRLSPSISSRLHDHIETTAISTSRSQERVTGAIIATATPITMLTISSSPASCSRPQMRLSTPSAVLQAPCLPLQSSLRSALQKTLAQSTPTALQSRSQSLLPAPVVNTRLQPTQQWPQQLRSSHVARITPFDQAWGTQIDGQVGAKPLSESMAMTCLQSTVLPLLSRDQ